MLDADDVRARAGRRNVGGPSGTGGGGSPGHSAQALAYLARTVGGNEGGNGENIATLIDGLVADGVWAKLDALYVLAQQNATDALLNLIGTSYTAANVGGSTFTAYKGFIAVGASYLNTTFDPTTAPSPHYTQNSASLGAWSYAVTPSSNTLMTDYFGGQSSLFDNYSGTTFYARINDATGTGVTTTITKGLFAGDRTNASNVYPYQNGISIGPVSSTSTPLATSGNGVKVIGTGNTSEIISAAFIGASLGAAGQLALYNRLRTYMTVIGVP